MTTVITKNCLCFFELIYLEGISIRGWIGAWRMLTGVSSSPMRWQNYSSHPTLITTSSCWVVQNLEPKDWNLSTFRQPGPCIVIMAQLFETPLTSWYMWRRIQPSLMMRSLAIFFVENIKLKPDWEEFTNSLILNTLKTWFCLRKPSRVIM